MDEGFPLCEPTSPCELCSDLPPEVWRRLLHSRRKRQLRAEKMATLASTSAEPPPSDSEPELDIVENSPSRPDETVLDSQVDMDEAMDILQTQQYPSTQARSYDEISASESSDHEEVICLSQTSSRSGTPVPDPASDGGIETPGVSILELSPEDLEISDFLRYVDEKTDFSATNPVPTRSTTPLRLESQRPAPSRASSFLCLNTSSAIIQHTEHRMADAQKMSSAEIPGRFPPVITSKGSMRIYQTSDRAVNPSALVWNPEHPKWIHDVRSSSKLTIRDDDIARIECCAREQLVICSSMDAFLSAAMKGLDDHFQADTDHNKLHPCVHKALSGVANGLFDTISRATTILHQTVMHRRDHVIAGLKIDQKFVRTLRHAPYLGEQFTFPPDVVSQVATEVTTQARDDAFHRIATTPNRPRPSKPAMTPKRPNFSPQSGTPAKKKKPSPSVSFAPSTKPAAPPTPSKAKPHR